MLLLVTRTFFHPRRVVSTFDVNGRLADGRVATGPFGFACEDTDRGLDALNPATWPRKVKKQTAIPVGEYEVGVRFSPSQGREVLYLKNVPAYNEGCVLVHAGNDEDDTEGCLLAALARTKTGVVKSKKAVDWLEKHVLPVARKPGAVRIRVQRDAAAWSKYTSEYPEFA